LAVGLDQAAKDPPAKPSTLRIGVFHTTLPAAGRKLGGVEVFVDRLVAQLCDLGHDVEAISLTPPPVWAKYRHRLLFARFPGLHSSRLLRLFVMPFLLNFQRFDDYDVVHFHGDDWFFVFRRVATVRTLNGSALWEARTATSKKRKILQYIIYPLEQISVRLCDVSLALGSEAAALYRTDDIANLFVANSVFFPGQKTALPSFIYIGLWEGRKRGRFVAERFLEEVLPAIPAAKLFMVCDFVPSHASIINLGAPGQAELAAVVRESWALLSASTYEGFGIPYLEALASGTAVISTTNSGARYVLNDGEFGMISSDKDFGRHVVAMAESAALREDFERRGLLRAARFSEQVVVDEHLAHYRLAVARFRA
jgi:glycosyltransferase involved in cell wall biosynthesis